MDMPVARRSNDAALVPPASARRAPRASAESLTEKAYRQIEELIVTLQIPPGTVVSEASLSERLDIGRTPIREALQRLARERLVVVLPRRGIMVSEINVRTQLRLLEVRRELERLIARSAARRATDAQRRRLDAIADAMAAAAASSDDLGFMRSDRELNLLALEAARNEFASGAMALMHGLSRRFWYIHYKEVADLPLAARLHANLALAIADGDGEPAAAASDRLLASIYAFNPATVTAA